MTRPRKSLPAERGLHFITCASYQHQQKLGAEKHRSLLCQLLEELRAKYQFQIVGYAVMPASIQVLLSAPEKDTVEDVMLTLRQRYQRRYNVSARSEEPAWEKKMTDVHVVTADHIVGCLSLMHHAPVKAGLAEKATDWEWSSARRYAGLPEGTVTVEPSPDPRAYIPA